jgi:predicted lipoprotein with Yx(FWY)xxD motif
MADGDFLMSKSQKTVLLFLCLSILSISALAQSSDYSVNVSANKFLGSYLVNQTGFTLYYFSNDSNANEASTCYDECAETWKPFYAENMTLPDSLRPIDFAAITRTDESKQTTFKNWPLYLYSRDQAAGDTYGSGKEGTWHVVSPTDQPQRI